MQNNEPRKDPRLKPETSRYDQPQEGMYREGGDDALNAAPDDARLDEKVIVNEQRSDKTVNAPSQTAANTSEVSGSDEEL